MCYVPENYSVAQNYLKWRIRISWSTRETGYWRSCHLPTKTTNVWVSATWIESFVSKICQRKNESAVQGNVQQGLPLYFYCRNSNDCCSVVVIVKSLVKLRRDKNWHCIRRITESDSKIKVTWHIPRNDAFTRTDACSSCLQRWR